MSPTDAASSAASTSPDAASAAAGPAPAASTSPGATSTATGPSPAPTPLPEPAYDRSAGEHLLVHLGVGGFHRAHQALYLDELRAGGDLSWREVGVGLLPGDAAMAEVMAAQDCLYTLVTVEPDGTEHARRIGAISDYLHAPADPQGVLELLADPRVGILTLTITEGGYDVDESRERFVPRTPDVRRDLDRAEGEAPRSALGYLEAALALRQERGLASFTVLSCDNVPENGQVMRTALLGFARARGSRAADLIETEVAFPSCMVDRITPAATDAVRAHVREAYGITDAWPVRAESFRQWVIEDRFPQGRPAWERVGAQMVADVNPYEQMKLRMLNAAHQAIAYPGLLLGLELVDEAMADADIRELVSGYLVHEALPTVPAVPGIDLRAYAEDLLARFSSTAVRDTLERLAYDASDRIPTFLLPVIRDRRAADQSADRGVLVVAAWIAMLRERADRDLAVDDPRAEALREAVRSKDPVGAVLGMREVLGELGEDPGFAAEVRERAQQIREHGIREVLQEVVGGQ